MNRFNILNRSTPLFGTALTTIARKLLPTVELHSLAEILKKQFIDGLQNKDVAEKVMLKFYEKKSINKILSVDETIELAKHIENAHIVTQKFNRKDDTSNNSSLCMIDKIKQDQEPTFNNNNKNNCSNINNSSTQTLNNNDKNNFKNLQPKQKSTFNTSLQQNTISNNKHQTIISNMQLIINDQHKIQSIN
jgi:hypothetical protein